MPGSAERFLVLPTLWASEARYVRPDVVHRVRAFLAGGGSYDRDVSPAIAAAMLAESNRH